jgi:hypothetical protein
VGTTRWHISKIVAMMNFPKFDNSIAFKIFIAIGLSTLPPRGFGGLESK